MTEAIIAIIAALGGTAGLIKIIDAIKKRPISEEQKNFNLTILRYNLITLYEEYKEDTYLPPHVKEIFFEMYDQYKALGGNSYVSQLAREFELKT